MRRVTVGRWAVLVLLVCLLPSRPSAGSAQQPGMLSEVVEVRVVNLEVVVTDRKGNRVRGLQPGDFRLWIDDKPTAIDYFTEVADGKAAASAEGATGMPSTAPGEEVETSYLVFIDDFFSIVRDRNRVLSAIADQLELLGPRDQMALVAWDGRRLESLSSWTSSRPALKRAIEGAKARRARGLQQLMAAISDFEVQGPDVESAIDAVVATLRAFAAPPGRKVLLVLSGGWPTTSADLAAPGKLVHNPASRRFAEGAELVAPVVQTANLLGYTIYAIDVPGMTLQSPFSADRANPVDHPGIDLREQSLHYTLSRLAEPTGGKALLNVESLSALKKVSLDTRSYYWLGFTADRQFDEREHKVHVEVTRPGLRVRHREGYRDFSREREVTMAVESDLLFGHPSAVHSFPVRVGAARRDGIGKVSMPLELDIPAEAVTFLPTAAGWTATLDLRMAAKDDAGATAPVAVLPLSFTLEQAPAPGTFLHYATTVRLRRRHHTLVVSVHDRSADSVLATQMDIDPR